PEQLMVLASTNTPRDLESQPVTRGDFIDWRARSRSFQDLAAYEFMTFNYARDDGAERLNGFMITPNFIDLLGLKPVAGRTFLPTECEAGKDDVVILSEQF